MDHGDRMHDSSSDHSSRASPVCATSPKHPSSPGSQGQQQQQQHQSQHQQSQRDQMMQPSMAHQQPHPRDQLPPSRPTPGSPTRGSPPQGLPLSPPPLSGSAAAPTGMVPRMPGLPPPGLGLLGQLGGMLGAHHGSPLELMAAHHAVMPPRNYSSPPPISTSDPTANECKLVDYRGQKVAAFIIAGDTMLCLPQAFELFLKHLVGGLHTVYTKLKRLDIVPLVCNVEQVRILRGLGAIQPGVNRCKLLSCKDFDVLYRDCTTARPGRPPKRASVSLSLAASHMAASAGAHAHQLKKHRLDNGDYYENGHLERDLNQLAYRFGLGEVPRMEKSPLLANGYNHPPTHLSHIPFMQLSGHPGAGHTALLSPANLPHHLQVQAQARATEQGLKVNQNMPNMEALARSGAVWDNCRAAYEDIVKQLERLRDERGESERALALDHKQRDHSSHNGSSNGHSPVLNLSKTAGSGSVGEHSGSEDGASHRSHVEEEEEDNLSEDLEDEIEKDEDLSDVPENLPLAAPGSESPQALNYSQIASAAAAVSAQGNASQDPTAAASSTETLLRNIQGLLKVAADNARQQEKQINYEKAELQMDVLRERQVKDNLERQLLDEQKIRVIYQKRFKRERRSRKQTQDQLELETKRRLQLEEALKATGATPEQIRAITESVSLETLQRRRSRSVDPADASPAHSSHSGPHPGPASGRSSNASSSTQQQQQQQQQQRDQQREQRDQREQQREQNKRDKERGDRSEQQYRDSSQSSRSSTQQQQQGQGQQQSQSSTTHSTQQQSQSQTQQQQQQQQQQQPVTPEKPGWGYSGLDLIGSQASAFWQNYQESLAEFEIERKQRQHSSSDRDQVKSPLQESRAGYYKNSVLFTSAT
ncbi:dachshund homolog 2 isoform X2 [Trichogramma pretiosum]|uniref:dachshund homolog 2 isoform X2 n=1 Tax=Trichogramma pretiosum TaxID=7493 RepID=UPI000C719D09|nr:dachshund homolog 2 isoform X2 [Trichogramma pretiosum]